MPLVVDVGYKFTCPPHAKVGLAFRYGLEVNENEVLAYFLGWDRDDAREGRSRVKLQINNTKVLAIVESMILITVLPSKAVFSSNDAKLINSAFDIIYAMDPSFFNVADIVDWRSKWIESHQSIDARSLSVDDLRREISKKTKLEAREPDDAIMKDSDSELGPNVSWKESAENAWGAVEGYEERIGELEELIKHLEVRLDEAQIKMDHAKTSSISSDEDKSIVEQLSNFDISDIERESVQLGVPSYGDVVGMNTRNKQIYRHDHCTVVNINLSESGSDGWYELIVKYGNQYYVLTTRFKTILSSYRLGDTVIYTAKYGSKNFLDSKPA